MTTFEGPAISTLHHRMTSTPQGVISGAGIVYLPALVHDLLYRHCDQFSPQLLAPFRASSLKYPWYASTYLMLYFLSDPAFASLKIDPHKLSNSLCETAKALYSAGKNQQYVKDVDRREEFIRVVLAAIELRPQGESKVQANDRLMTVSSIERQRVMRASKAAEKRAASIRIALAKKAALEAADKMTRE